LRQGANRVVSFLVEPKMKVVGLNLLHRLVAHALPICLSAVSANAAVPQEPQATPIAISGDGFVIGRLDSGAKAFSNRPYVWVNVPTRFAGWQFTEIRGGKAADLTVRSNDDTDVYIATTQAAPEGWEPVVGGTFAYNDKNGTVMHIYGRHLDGRTVLQVPQGGWAGTLVLAPALSGVANSPVVEKRAAADVIVDVQPAVVVGAAVVVTKVHKHHHSDRAAEHRAVVAEKKAVKSYKRQVKAYNREVAAQRRYAAAHPPVYRRRLQRLPLRRRG
jgi:hypothetical protein